MNAMSFSSSPMQQQPLALDLELPWNVDQEHEDKFYRLIKRIILGVCVFLVIVQFLPVFELTKIEEEEVVKTTVMLEPREEPVVEPEKPVPPPQPKVKPKPKPQKPTVAKKQSSKPAAPKKEKESVIASQGLDDLSSQLSALTGALDMQKLRKKNVTNSERGKVAQNSEERLGKDNLTRRSGGVVVDDEIMKADVSALAAHESAEVEGLDFTANIPGGTSDSYGSIRQGMRDMESIRRTLESTKSRVYTIYQRALAENPDLSGKFTFKLVIEPSGKISKLVLVSSELGIKELEDQILNNIQKVNFGQADVLATPVQYKFVFLPS